MNNNTTITADENSPIVRIERAFQAPRDKVFAIFTHKDMLEKWWNPYGDATIEITPEAGGSWKFEGGQEASFFGYFHEVTAPERIVQTSEFAHLPERGHVVLERYEFTEQEDGTTRMTLTNAFLSVADRDAALQSGMEEGLEPSYKKIDELLEATK